MRPSPHDAYRRGAVTTASPAQLVGMMYSAAIEAIQRAETSINQGGQVADAHRELTRAQDIVVELQLSLDHEGGGAIAGSLASLYDFCLDRLVRANLSKDPMLLPAVARVLGGLSEAWETATNALPAAEAV